MKSAYVVRNHNGTYLSHFESPTDAQAEAELYERETGNYAFVYGEYFIDVPDIHLY